MKYVFLYFLIEIFSNIFQDVEFVSDLEDESDVGDIEDIDDGFEWEQENERENVAYTNQKAT